MDYRKIYNQLIERAKDRVPEGYVERHHVVPRCMGGNDDKDNLVALYPEEHFVAHALLLKIYKDTEHRHVLAKAVNRMCSGHTGKRVRRKLYGWLKREHALAMSVSQSGKNNSQFGSQWICNPETKTSKKIKKGEQVPIGWDIGRIFTKKFPESSMKGKTRVFKSEESRQEFSRKQRMKSGYKHTDAAKQKISLTRTGQKHTEATKRKISEAKRKPL